MVRALIPDQPEKAPVARLTVPEWVQVEWVLVEPEVRELVEVWVPVGAWVLVLGGLGLVPAEVWGLAEPEVRELVEVWVPAGPEVRELVEVWVLAGAWGLVLGGLALVLAEVWEPEPVVEVVEVVAVEPVVEVVAEVVAVDANQTISWGIR